MIKERDQHYKKNLQGQQQFNNQLAADHKQQTDKIRAAVGGRAADADDPVAGAEQAVKYDSDPQVIQLLNDVVNFRLG